MAEKKTKILFKRSSVPDRVPSANTLDYGEIALNYASGAGKSFISLKKANNEIAQFMEKDYNDANYANKAFVDTIDTNLETLRQDVIDNEEVVATVFNIFNESAGFDSGGNSTLGVSLTDAIIDLQNDVVALEDNLSENYVTSANTVAAINAVDGKFANYATSANTAAAINAVDGKFANYATSADTVAAIKVVQDDVDALRQDVIDNEEVIATAFNTFNESAGFDDAGNSILGMSLTDAIIDLQNEWGHQGAQGPQGPKGTDLTSGAYLPTSGGMISGPLVISGTLNATGTPNGCITFTSNPPCSFGAISPNGFMTISTTKTNPLYGYITSAITSVSATTTKSAYTTTTTDKVYLVGTTSFSSGNGGLYKYTGVTMSANCIFATSDERLKDFYEDIDCDLDELKNVPKKYFSWKDDADKGRQIGTSAQELYKLYPEIVSIDDEGTHSVAYDRLSIVALAAIDKLYDMVKELKEENQLLKQRLDSIND